MVDLSKNTETDREITAFFWNYQIFSEKKRIFVWIIVLAVNMQADYCFSTAWNSGFRIFCSALHGMRISVSPSAYGAIS